ncbi:MAG: HemK2/MTQ2 family protein methyltransferase [archaeon]|nr:HemK2/MTQ2 family protein methyltransferase [archaeon]
MILRYKAFSIETDENVYEPSDDTYLLMDAFAKIRLNKGLRVLEIGCGSGIVSVALSKTVGSIVACDINPYAVKLTEKNIQKNKIKNVKVIKSDLFDGVKGKFDLIIFNTPYLPQSVDEKVTGYINKAWDGGCDGRKVIDRFLLEAPPHLFENGFLVFVESSLSHYEKSIAFLESCGFRADIISREKHSFEEIVVIKAEKKS